LIIDFEVEDALGKLERLRMVERRLAEIWKQSCHALA
jgi:hypothetical protein